MVNASKQCKQRQRATADMVDKEDELYLEGNDICQKYLNNMIWTSERYVNTYKQLILVSLY